MSARHSPAASFVAIELFAADRGLAERAAAEAYAAGATGLEEREHPEGVWFIVYAPAARAGEVRAALSAEGALPGPAVPVPEQDWSERWKRGLSAIAISPRLMLRPSFDATEPLPGQHVLTIDPGQAFGTGVHESTRLALECIDALAADLTSDSRVLDVGTGTGVLALAALSLGCGFACGLDVDPLAGEAAHHNARRNGLAERLALFVGTPDALASDARFDLVFANMLWNEIEPLLPRLALHLRIGGRLIVSGLLEEQRAGIERAAAGHGLRVDLVRERVDANGASWTGLVMRRERAGSSP